MNSSVLKTKNFCKRYSNRLVVDHVSLEIKSGQIYGFIGKNGAGKTTFMRMVCGLVTPTGGEIELFGDANPANLSKHRRKLGCLIENPALYANMTAYENLDLHSTMSQ